MDRYTEAFMTLQDTINLSNLVDFRFSLVHRKCADSQSVWHEHVLFVLLQTPSNIVIFTSFFLLISTMSNDQKLPVDAPTPFLANYLQFGVHRRFPRRQFSVLVDTSKYLVKHVSWPVSRDRLFSTDGAPTQDLVSALW